jgi:PAS domain S-box-containing protein
LDLERRRIALDTPVSSFPPREDLGFLLGGGEMGALIRAHDWAKTSLGPPQEWPQPLRVAVGLILNSGHPMYLWWGPGLLCFYNDAYRRSIGPERHPSSLGKPGDEVWAEIWHVIGPEIEQVMAAGGATWHENQLIPITRDGKLEDVYWTYSYSPLHDPSAPSGVGGVLVVCSETTETVLALEKRAEEVVRQREIFAQAPGFTIIMSGPEHRVAFVNDSHRRLFGSDEWVGKAIREAFSELAGQGFFELLDRVYSTGHAYRSGGVPVRFRPAGSSLEQVRILDFIYAPTYDSERQINGVFCEGFDVTQQIEAEKALREREEQLRLATEAADVGLWDVDLVSSSLFWQPRVKAMFGISADVEVSMADFYAGLHPDDSQRVSESFDSAIDPSRRALYDVEYRTVGREDGVVRWIAAKGRGIFDEQNECFRVIGTAIDITARRAMQDLLRRSEERLRLADRRKDEFLATLAHELRNPLAPIGNAAAVLKHPGSPRDQVTRFAEMIERQTKAMAVLLDDLLEVSRISTGKLLLKKRVVSVASLVESALEPVRPALETKKRALRIEMDGGEVLLDVDPIRVSQVLTNLLTNAVKYSDQGGAIVLRARSSPAEVTFEVEDTGIGLSTEQIPTIFDMFAQVSPAIERSEGGLGIGLAVAKALVEMHGGRISAGSPGLGMGSRFTVVMPRGAARSAASEFQGETPQTATRRSRAPIVIADDNVDAAESLAALLELEGYVVHVAHDGMQAFQIASEVNPVACFLDIGMPGMDGYELARRLKATSEGAGMFLVATTGWGKPEDKRRSEEAGFDLHMTKPIDVVSAARALADRQIGAD